MTHEHTYGCHGTDPCAPIEGQWPQPSDFAIREARGLVPVDAPWCVVRVQALTIDDQDGTTPRRAVRSHTECLADIGQRHLQAFADEMGLDLHPEADGPALAIGDLFCDLLHAYGPDEVAAGLANGQWHYESEIEEVSS